MWTSKFVEMMDVYGCLVCSKCCSPMQTPGTTVEAHQAPINIHEHHASQLFWVSKCATVWNMSDTHEHHAPQQIRMSTCATVGVVGSTVVCINTRPCASIRLSCLPGHPSIILGCLLVSRWPGKLGKMYLGRSQAGCLLAQAIYQLHCRVLIVLHSSWFTVLCKTVYVIYPTYVWFFSSNILCFFLILPRRPLDRALSFLPLGTFYHVAFFSHSVPWWDKKNTSTWVLCHLFGTRNPSSVPPLQWVWALG